MSVVAPNLFALTLSTAYLAMYLQDAVSECDRAYLTSPQLHNSAYFGERGTQAQ
jgi:hypothetical protein